MTETKAERADQALVDLAAKLGMRVSARWEATPAEQDAYAHDHAENGRMMKADESDIQIASRVRMLMCNDLDHEAVICCARDRICTLWVEKQALLAACQSVIPKNLCLDNPNIPDEQVIPLDFTMGELRQIQAAISLALGGAEHG